MLYEVVTLPAFTVVGIQVKTDNSQGPKGFIPLWQQFYAENIQSFIPHKADNDVIALYTDYESDYTGRFTFFIGCRVSAVHDLPQNLVAKRIPEARYAQFIAKGQFSEAIGKTWHEIWNTPLDRSYKADFEIYGDRFFGREEQKEVPIYIGVK